MYLPSSEWIVGGGMLLIGSAVGLWLRIGPGVRIAAVADAILGKAEVMDRKGGTIEPGQPGLVHRVAQVEEAVVEFRHVIGLLTETQKRLDAHDRAINALISGSLERAATAMSSAALLQAVANNDLLDVDDDG